MGQVKSNQITPAVTSRKNPIQAPPRDVHLDVSDVVNSIASQPSSNTTATATTVTAATSNNLFLDTPVVLNIKSQTLNFQSDGSTAVDVVLTASDITGAAEYEIRIAKSAGAI